MSKIDEKLSALGIEPESGGEFTPMTEAEVREIENRIGATLPEGYRRFLTTYGSSLFGQDVYYRDQKYSDPVLFGWFFGANSLHGAIEPYSEALPKGIIPIGDDGGGNLYALGVTGGDKNKVFFHDHTIGWNADARKFIERGEDVPAALRYQTVYQIADSFETFIDGMFHQE